MTVEFEERRQQSTSTANDRFSLTKKVVRNSHNLKLWNGQRTSASDKYYTEILQETSDVRDVWFLISQSYLALEF